MRRITLAALLLIFPSALSADQAEFRVPLINDSPGLEAPAAWDHQDPADALYRSAREAMNGGDYERAADLFRQVWDRYPRSTYAPDALYWEAFNRYRLGDTNELHMALEILETQAQRYSQAATRRNGDAESLKTRISGVLARRGDSDAAESIVAMANELAGMGARIGVEVSEQMSVMAEQMALRGELMGEHIAQMAEEGVAIGMAGGFGHASMQEIPEQCREQVENQLAALNALLHMSTDRAMPVLKRVMERRDECSTPLRRRAMFLVAEQRSPETVDVLLKASQDDPDLEVRRQAVFWLSEVDDPRAVSALEQFVTQSEDTRIRERAIFALSQTNSPEARRVLRQVARDDSYSVELRSKAIFWLGEEGSDEDLDFLKEMFGQYPNQALNERILFTIGQAERSQDARWLLSIAQNAQTDMELRRSAIFWAAEAGAPAAALGDLYSRLDDRKLKERILFGLSESGQPAALDKLIEIVRTEQDSELRKKAIFWLGNSDDPRAADVLMEVLMEGEPGGSR